MPFGLEEAEAASSSLASIAEPRFVHSIKELAERFDANGQKACIATHRLRIGADGEEAGPDDPATFITEGYEFYAGEDEWTVYREPELENTGAAQMLAQELALLLDPMTTRAIRDLKIILDRFGGQAWIAPYMAEEQIIGFLFHYEHISKLARGKEPDSKLEEPIPLVVSEATVDAD